MELKEYNLIFTHKAISTENYSKDDAIADGYAYLESLRKSDLMDFILNMEVEVEERK